MRQLDLFYNTTNLFGSELKEHQMRAGTQNKIILDYFKSVPGLLLTPFDVQKLFPGNVPITSIRRSLTTLTNLGYLLKTDNKRIGEYGEMNHTWKLKT